MDNNLSVIYNLLVNKLNVHNQNWFIAKICKIVLKKPIIYHYLQGFWIKLKILKECGWLNTDNIVRII